jgi:inorganic pyrophosphatase
MKHKIIIEIPKGCDRRIHLHDDKSVFIDLGPIKDEIPVNDGVMPIAYGYIEGTLNKEENDEVDVIVFSSKAYNTGDKIDAEIIGMLTRKDADHKVIASGESSTIKTLNDIPADELNLILKYFGYKSEIVSIDSKELAEDYIKSCAI